MDHDDNSLIIKFTIDILMQHAQKLEALPWPRTGCLSTERDWQFGLNTRLDSPNKPHTFFMWKDEMWDLGNPWCISSDWLNVPRHKEDRIERGIVYEHNRHFLCHTHCAQRWSTRSRRPHIPSRSSVMVSVQPQKPRRSSNLDNIKIKHLTWTLSRRIYLDKTDRRTATRFE